MPANPSQVFFFKTSACNTLGSNKWANGTFRRCFEFYEAYKKGLELKPLLNFLTSVISYVFTRSLLSMPSHVNLSKYMQKFKSWADVEFRKSIDNNNLNHKMIFSFLSKKKPTNKTIIIKKWMKTARMLFD